MKMTDSSPGPMLSASFYAETKNALHWLGNINTFPCSHGLFRAAGALDVNGKVIPALSDASDRACGSSGDLAALNDGGWVLFFFWFVHTHELF